MVRIQGQIGCRFARWMFVRGGRFWMVIRTKESWSFRSTLAWVFVGLVSKPAPDKQESVGSRSTLASWLFVRHLRFRLVKNKFRIVIRTKESWSFRSTLAWVFVGLVSKPAPDKQESVG